VQIHSKLHKPPLKVNNFSALLIIDFRNVGRIMGNRRDAKSGVRHAELDSASGWQRQQVLKSPKQVRGQHDP
jgi:hypothetical protein